MRSEVLVQGNQSVLDKKYQDKSAVNAYFASFNFEDITDFFCSKVGIYMIDRRSEN